MDPERSNGLVRVARSASNARSLPIAGPTFSQSFKCIIESHAPPSTSYSRPDIKLIAPTTATTSTSTTTSESTTETAQGQLTHTRHIAPNKVASASN